MANLLDLVVEAGAGIILKKIGSSPKRGTEYQGPCPSCGGEDRFHVWPEQKGGEGSYWCRGCGRGGDAVQFCMDFLGMSFPEAAKHVGRPPAVSVRRMGLPRTQAGRGMRLEATPAHPVSPPEQWASKSTEFAKKCHEALVADSELLEWLSGRGIDVDTAKRFGLGWNTGDNGKDCYRDRAAWGLPEKLNAKTDKPKPLWLPVGLTVPLVKNRVVERLRIRRPHPESGPEGLKNTRYYIVPGSSMEQLLIRPAAPVIVVVEAELDAMAVAAAAPDCVGVLALGSSSSRPDVPAMAALQKSLHILVALDFDAAGAGAWDARLRTKGRTDGWCWRRAFPQAERWPTPDGKDPGDAVKAGVDLAAWITAGLPPVLTLPAVKAPTVSTPDSGTSGHASPGLPLVWGAGDFLAGAKETRKVWELEAFLARHEAAGVRLHGLLFEFPEDFPEALRAEAVRVFDAVEDEWIETEGWTK